MGEIANDVAHVLFQVAGYNATKRIVSSNLAEVGYDARTQTLEACFKNGGIYYHLDVLASIYHDLKDADSLGRYLNCEIKGRYRYARV